MPVTSQSPAAGRPALPARQRILDAAEQLFAAHGYDHTSAEQIAVAAAVPTSQVSYHFPAQMDLLLAVVGINEIIAEAGVYSSPHLKVDPRQAIAEIWRNLAASLSQASAMTTITFQELPRHPELRQHALQAGDRITDIVSHQLARAAGHTGEPLPRHTAAARVLTIVAATIPLTGNQHDTLIDTTALAELLAAGLA